MAVLQSSVNNFGRMLLAVESVAFPIAQATIQLFVAIYHGNGGSLSIFIFEPTG